MNVVMIPVLAYADWLLLKGRIKWALGKEPAVWHFLPATFLELMMFNVGIVVGATLK